MTAPAKEVLTWSGENITIADVVRSMEDLRRSEQRAATRTSVATLIVVTRTEEEMKSTEEVIDHLGVRHPARIITLLSPKGAGEGDDNIDAAVTLHAGEAAGHAIWSDELRLTVSGGPARHTASLLRPLLLSDLPVVVWYVSGLPDVGDPLLKLANAVIVDTKTTTTPDSEEIAILQTFKEVARLARKYTMIDLSWNRLRPWRSLMASQFSGAVFKPFAHDVERIRIVGKLGPRMLLAGWLGSRLRLESEHIVLEDGRHVSLELHSKHAGSEAHFTVERIEGERLVKANVRIDGGPSHAELIALPHLALPLSLSEALRGIERDRVYEAAIKYAASWEK